MSDEKKRPENRELDSIVAGYLQAAREGRAPDREDLIAKHPALAADLRSFFEGQDEVAGIVSPLLPGSEGETVPRVDSPTLLVGEHVGPSETQDEAALDTAGCSRLPGILESYMKALEEGHAPSKDDLYDRYPELREPLRECFAALDFIVTTREKSDGPPAQLGDFRIIREIGSGGMGVVYEAEQVSLKRRVALKILPFAGTRQREELQRRFEREARTIAQMHHTHIVPVFASGCESGVHYFAMQYIEGEDLGKLVDEAVEDGSGRLDEKKAVRWALEMAEALGYAHDRGVIHRDVKPQNILVDASGQAWLTDFGLARWADDVTLTGTRGVGGTPRYMSPEQARGDPEKIDHRTDIYSLGATLYHLVTGKPVFDAKTSRELIDQLLGEDPVEPRKHDPRISRDLETIVLKCLEKDPCRRFQTARDLAGNLLAYLDGRSLSIRRYGRVDRMRRWAHQRRAAFSIAMRTLIVVGIVAGLVVGTVILQRTASRNQEQKTVRLHSDDRSITVDILHATEDRVVEGPLSLLRESSVELAPYDSYRIAVSKAGHMTETFLADWNLLRSSPRLGVFQKEAWPARPARHFSSVTRAGESPTLFVVAWKTLECLDATGFPVWTAPLDPEAVAVFASKSPVEMIPDARDLDGDDTEDLVWVSRGEPSVIAFSGTDGKLLWHHRAKTAEDESYAVIGMPPLADVDGDEVADLIVTYFGKQSFIEALSGRTGERIWRDHEVDEKGEVGSPIGAAQLVTMPTKQLLVVVLPMEQGLLVLDADTGKAHDDIRRVARVLNVPELVDLDPDKDDSLDAVFVSRDRRPHEGGDAERKSASVLLRAHSLHDWKELWEPVYLYPDPRDSERLSERLERYGHRQSTLRCLQVTDFEGDGTLDIVAPTIIQEAPSNRSGREWGIVRVDASTGKVRWKAPLFEGLYAPVEKPIRNFVVGPDWDGDMQQDLYLVRPEPLYGSMANKQNTEIHAVSSADPTVRRVYSYASQRAPTPRPPRYGPTTGWDLVPWEGPAPATHRLLVLERALEDKVSAWSVLSLATGDVARLAGSERPSAHDLDGDGFSDLCHLSGGTLNTIRGHPPVRWRRLGSWKPGFDINGDGVRDLERQYPGDMRGESYWSGRGWVSYGYTPWVSGASGEWLEEPDSDDKPGGEAAGDGGESHLDESLRKILEKARQRDPECRVEALLPAGLEADTVLVLREAGGLRGYLARTGELLWYSHGVLDPVLLSQRMTDSPPLVVDGDCAESRFVVCREVCVVGSSLPPRALPKPAQGSLGELARKPLSKDDIGDAWGALLGYPLIAYLMAVLPFRLLRSFRERRTFRAARPFLAYMLFVLVFAVVGGLLIGRFRLGQSLLCMPLLFVSWFVMGLLLLPTLIYLRTFLRSLFYGPWKTFTVLVLGTVACAGGLVIVAVIVYLLLPGADSRDSWWVLLARQEWWEWGGLIVAGAYLLGAGMGLRQLWGDYIKPLWQRIRRGRRESAQHSAS